MDKDEVRINLLEKLPKRSIGAEIGVHKGDFSQLIMQYVKPAKLHLVDPWKYENDSLYSESWYGGLSGGQIELNERFEHVNNRFSKEVDNGVVQIHRAVSEAALLHFNDNSLDWVYIDGNHLYEYVMKDLALSYQKVKLGGMICGDDYQLGGWWEGGVKKAVDEFVEMNSLSVDILGNQFIIFK
ncbi:class I SAM-dependent methyltransferase [Halomonas sp. MG34]|nr:class I SAM-dependent methyltransferase [Halomonas sp. MG34]